MYNRQLVEWVLSISRVNLTCPNDDFAFLYPEVKYTSPFIWLAPFVALGL